MEHPLTTTSHSFCGTTRSRSGPNTDISAHLVIPLRPHPVRSAEAYTFGSATGSAHGGSKGHNGGGQNIRVAYFPAIDYPLRTVGGANVRTGIGGIASTTEQAAGAGSRPVFTIKD
ncbi:hypothetical protein ACFFQW_04115 [Umezawaea endophytica]|uniref:Uncharacterized protein n=1 Tax=Umezawaea endophytica TaxID=1654476 RepID=A0A9X2VMP1_9PSEU|nr:hypothetical protein [Umezawaea endophytica]MCS7479336.1 hypothetical protein [Umezawaea endophytica]